MKILCIDPGPEKSGVVIFDEAEMSLVFTCHNLSNQALLVLIDVGPPCDKMVFEMMSNYGTPIGASVLDAVLWSGMFMHAFGRENVIGVYNSNIRLDLCGNVRVGESNIRQAVIDHFPATGGGKTPQIGTKKAPGPLYGMKSHAWSALAVGLAWCIREGMIDPRH